MPYYSKGTLSHQTPADLAEPNRISIEILRGVDALHKSGFVHCDIKDDNICMDHQGRPIIIDVGNVKKLFETDPPAELGGTEENQIDELDDLETEISMLLKPDIWALGTIFCSVWHGPFESDEERRNRLKLFEQNIPEDDTLSPDRLIG